MSDIDEIKQTQQAQLVRIERLEEALAKLTPMVPPIGAIVAFLGTPEQARDLRAVGWWVCDGGTVDDALSPMNGTALPDLRDKFLRGGQATGSTGGSNRATVPAQTIDSGTYGFGGDTIHMDPRCLVYSGLTWINGTPIRSRGTFAATTIDIDNPPYVSAIYLCRVR